MATAVTPASIGRELSDPPSDGISNLRFSNHSDLLLVSSWDKSVCLYDASANVLKAKFMHGGPVLDCCFHDDSSGFSAAADNTVRRLLFASNKDDILGKHDAPVRCVEYSYAAVSNRKARIIHEDYGKINLVKWVSSLLEQKGMDHVIDLTLDSTYREEISKVLSVRLLYTIILPINRPAMWWVVKMLREAATVPRSRSVREST